MRHGPVLGGLFGAVAVSPFVLAPDTPAPRSPHDASAALSLRAGVTASARGDPAREPRTIVYRGLRLPVPQGWRVYDLHREPRRCLRYDQRAIYLGSPSARADCPARLVGAEDVLHVAPEPAVPAGPAAAEAGRRRLAHHTVRPTTDHQVRLPVPEAGVTINGRYGEHPGGLQSLIRSTSLTGTTEPPPEEDDESEKVTDADDQAEASKGAKPQTWVKGKGFDTCAAPSLSAMRAWRPSFKVSNIYIGGAARACAQPNLTSAWVESVRAMGYRLVPTYVGLQAPCGRYKSKFTAQSAALEGKEAAVDAVLQAKALGIPERQPIYYDMEAYPSSASCREAVMTFLHNWTVKLQALRYVPGVYGSVGSVVRDLVKATDVRRPTALWFAHWDGRPAVYGHPMIPDDLWHPHRRIKQYRGGHKETHGGVTINIDSNQVDGRVY